MHINFAFDILNKNFLDCVIEAKNKADERKSAVKMLSSLAQSEKILAIMDRGFDGLKMIEHCKRILNLSYLIRVRSTKMNEIAALPDEELDLDLKFEVRTQSKRLPYKTKIQAWDMDLPCSVSFRLVKIKLKDKWLVLATNFPHKDTSRIISQVRLTKPKNLKYHYEINVKNAAQIVQDYCRNLNFYYEKILEQISKYVHPVSFNYRVA